MVSGGWQEDGGNEAGKRLPSLLSTATQNPWLIIKQDVQWCYVVQKDNPGCTQWAHFGTFPFFILSAAEKQREVVFRNRHSSCRPRVRATGSSWPPVCLKGTLVTLTTSAQAPFHYWVGGGGCILVSMETGREARAQQPPGGGSRLPQSCQAQPKETRRIRTSQRHCQPIMATVAIPALCLEEKIMKTIMWLAKSPQRKSKPDKNWDFKIKALGTISLEAAIRPYKNKPLTCQKFWPTNPNSWEFILGTQKKEAMCTKSFSSSNVKEKLTFNRQLLLSLKIFIMCTNIGKCVWA